MKIGLVGYQGSGKSTLFEWLTTVPADPSQAHTAQSAMATIPEPRVEQLVEIYHPKKITQAALEIVDTPGLSRTHEGNAARLALIREAGCLVLVVAAFDDSDPMADRRSFDEDLMLADMEVLSGRIGRIEETLKKPIPRTEQEQLRHEEETLNLVLSAMEAGKPLREADMTDEQLKVTRAFRLLSEKPRMVIVNTADDEADPDRFTQTAADVPVLTIPAGLELELARMSPDDRREFEEEMGLESVDRDHVIRRLLEASGQMLFFTCGDREVRTWLLARGGTALEAADNIHTDLARGFIRAEVMTVSDLVQFGSEREVKAQHLMRQEPKDYVIQDDDIVLIRFSV
ncbi:MAG: redox-regulated ATPase YchF [Pirellulales bacterium]|nr:redox-regulated ATPase YchF [Pirellulales bacterium]